jgi:uncharacterized glyoxalase superfamily protein PhnB
MAAPRLDLIGLVVKDIEASVRFYKMLGIDVPDGQEGPHWEAVLPNGLRLAWDSEELIKGIVPHWVEPVGHRMGMAFLCDSPADVDTKHAELVRAGYESAMEPWDAFWGQRYAQIKDPDGNLVDLFAPL